MEDKVEVKDIGESSEATEMVEESAPAPAIAEPAAEPAAEEEKEEEPVQKTQSKENAKKILFAASVIGVAAKVLAGKGKGLGRKKATVPAEPEFTTYCYGEGVAKKTGLPLVCFRLPKKIGKIARSYISTKSYSLLTYSLIFKQTQQLSSSRIKS